jgi:hypothetical protein
MKFPQDLIRPSAVSTLIASGSLVAVRSQTFVPRLPSTWPPVGPLPDASFVDILERLFVEGMLTELSNVCDDITFSSSTGMQGRGHVVALAMMSILDSVSQFANPSEPQRSRIPNYVHDYFDPEYDSIRQDLSDRYRNGLVHEWFMREVAFLPGNEPLVIQQNSSPVLGLLTFRDALSASVHRFLTALRTDGSLRERAARRYSFLQQHIRD